MVISLMSVWQKFLDCATNSFELFGYDFILDFDLKPWLIEVNTNPCLEESSGILKVLLPWMLDDMLKLTVD